MRYFQKFWLFIFIVVIMALTANRCTGGADPKILPVDESYKRDQPIEFPHDIHAGKLGIDCKYCHNSAVDGKERGIPTANVCTKCHQEVKGEPENSN